MSSSKIIRFLILLLIPALFAGLVGCAQKTPTPDEIVNSAVTSMNEVDTYKYDLNLSGDYYKDETSGDPIMKDVIEAGGTLDNAKKEMHTTVDYSTSLQGQPMRQTLLLEFFVTDDESLMKLALSTRTVGWSKADPELAWESLDQATQQIGLLESAAEVDLSGTETVNSIDYYVIKATPDGEKLAGWLSRQLALISLGNLPQAKEEELVSFSIRFWIARDTYLLARTELEIERAARDGRGKIKGQTSFSDYGQPVSIEIPQEARESTGAGTPK